MASAEQIPPESVPRWLAVPSEADSAPVWSRPIAEPGGRPPAVWLLGAHGGAGVSTLEKMWAPARDSRRGWPASDTNPFVVIVSRMQVSGLDAAHQLALQHRAQKVGDCGLLGLVTVAAAPGKPAVSVVRRREIVAAAAGATVAKHGNRTHTRASGSAEAIAQLGVNLDAPVPVLQRCLASCHIAFLYAPNLHPAMKYAGPARQALGIRTIFNLLGPLTNPAGAKRQLLGTCRPDLTETLAAVLAARGATFAWVAHAHNGLCDLSITGPTQITEIRDGCIRTFHVRPEEVGLTPAPLEALIVDSPQASATAIRDILEQRDLGPRRDHALLNAAAALVVAGLADNLHAGMRHAITTVDSGAAHATLEQLVLTSNQ